MFLVLCTFVLLSSAQSQRDEYTPNGWFYRTNSHLGEVPSDIPESVVRLYLSNNSIETLNSKDFDDMVDLTLLDLRGNLISEIESRAFSDLESVTELLLQDNYIRSLYTDIFTGLTSLNKLFLGNNRIAQIPVRSFQGLGKLIELHLQNNDLANLKTNMFAGMPLLEVLDLTNNSIATMESTSFYDLSNLKKLSLSGSSLTELQTNMFLGLNSLEELEISKNRIISIQDGAFAGLSNLKQLWLDNNIIMSVNFNMFLALHSLERLVLHHNMLTTITGGIFTGLFELQMLDLDDNKIAEIRDDSFRGLEDLDEVRLNNNQLRTLDSSTFSGLPRDLKLSMGMNPLECNQNLCWLKSTLITWVSYGNRKSEPECSNGLLWDAFKLNCVSEVYCSDPGNVQYATRSGEGPYGVGSRVDYACVGFCVIGSGSITCQSTGQWTRKPVCTSTISCPTPNVNNAVRITDGSESVGSASAGPFSCDDVVVFACDTGFRLVGSGIVMRCRADGQWYQLHPGYCRIAQTTDNSQDAKCNSSSGSHQTRWLVISIVAGVGGIFFAIICTTTCVVCARNRHRARK